MVIRVRKRLWLARLYESELVFDIVIWIFIYAECMHQWKKNLDLNYFSSVKMAKQEIPKINTSPPPNRSNWQRLNSFRILEYNQILTATREWLMKKEAAIVSIKEHVTFCSSSYQSLFPSLAPLIESAVCFQCSLLVLWVGEWEVHYKFCSKTIQVLHSHLSGSFRRTQHRGLSLFFPLQSAVAS